MTGLQSLRITADSRTQPFCSVPWSDEAKLRINCPHYVFSTEFPSVTLVALVFILKGKESLG